ncbi:GNAT family N-acetyltransferase [Mycobacterium sp. C31M]
MSSFVRPATTEDVATVEHIVAAAYVGYVDRIGREPAPMTADYHVLLGQTALLIVDDAIVGVIVTLVADDHLLIENVAVGPGHQGKGYGRALLDHAETQARRQGLTEARLYTNAAMTENLAFYPRLGYVETGRCTEDGFDRVYFRKQL